MNQPASASQDRQTPSEPTRTAIYGNPGDVNLEPGNSTMSSASHTTHNTRPHEPQRPGNNPTDPDPAQASLAAAAGFTEGVQAIARERGRQITALGYTAGHDARHPNANFVDTAIFLLSGREAGPHFPGVKRADPDSGMYERDDLVRAGALIAAAIDQLDAAVADHG